ncbi:M56 family metallopeptidase [Massilia sp. PAMC28688]|uniref:M56 family metallopeptidase n=1 Tax=Massilia sp. PAMC28688 TaxID=2861283 RepID=UPI001C63A356|nr:M56 family metallopeptidase [Massilia sp. PAMC28688]QYF92833.1 M56 family metallopeptidase [Massilia sp. PAMC28688]
MTLPFLVDCLGWTLLHFIWQGALVGSITALLLAALRNAGPMVRYNVACAGLLACVMWPAAELTLRLQGADMVTAQMRFADALFTGAGGSADGLSAFLQGQMLWIVGLWASCAAVLALRMGLGLLWIERSRAGHGTDARLQATVTRLAGGFGVSRKVLLRVVPELSSPQTAGWFRPVVLVPASLATGMPPDLLEALLAHEMAHIRRHDYIVNLMQHAVEIIFFYQPAVWWLSRRIRAEREQIADDLAARHTGSPRTLARALSELERFQFSSHHLAVGADGGELLARVKRLVRPDAQALNWTAVLPALGLAAACLGLYAHASTPQLANPQLAVLDQMPVALFDSCAKPQYPAADLAAGHTGTTRLGFEVDVHGKVVASRVNRTSGHAGLDAAAHRAIAKCSFIPGRAGGKPVQAWMEMQYVWTLN